MTASVGTGTLRFAAVAKTFDNGTIALSEVDLDLAPGDFVSVVGPSGCGKSTLLRLASGLTAPTGGEIFADTGKIGYVFQDPTLLEWRSAAKNVELAGELHGMARAERRKRAAEALELVGLAGFEKQLPGQLSGGMRMRVSLARALTLDPEIFLFDEPFGALDEITRLRMQDELQRLFRTQGFTGLFITHSVTEAVYLSTRVAVMSARPGRIVREVDVPFPFPRSPEIRYHADFARIAGEVSAALKEASS
ncbi:MAG TPA: ABC transporter ATP-binding protein [Amycolatopsis sp.]|uniref:ABC transporter ATP-binding protein n=1 Tax=Amycolatopsis sp. TaxID=37632 RepID=UPI002B47BB61|nr:ABC transporter ATP-binding protein [Amycolatopsis sp.]HKS44861.1 ABC transporter ATP-binding protein [Amycolatopsis sp.]